MPRRVDERPDRPERSGGSGGGAGGMGCEAVRDRLEPWLDGELEAPVARGVRDHLDGCAGCRDELALARRLRQALDRELPMLSCPPEVTDRVLAAVAEEAAHRRGSGAGVERTERTGRAAQGPKLAGPVRRLVERLAGAGALRPALAAAALLVLLVAAPLLYRAVVGPETPGRTASGPDEAPLTTQERPDTTEYTPAEVARAEEEARLVLGYVAAVGRDAGRTVQEEVFAQGLARPARRVIEGLEGGGPGVAAPAAEEPADPPRRQR